MTVATLPKVELHLHLEGAAPPAFIRGLADRGNIDLSGVFAEDGSYKYTDFKDFLRVYEAVCATLTGPAEFHDLTRAVLDESAANGVVYSEAFLSPDFCGGDPGAWREYLDAIRLAAEEARKSNGIVLKGIVTCIRHLGPEQAKSAAMRAAETAGDFIRGFGMAGDENVGKATDFAWSFDCAREAGLRLTCHAGEWAGPESVRDALELGVERIGHGVRAIEDSALVERLAGDGIALEICPGSNVRLGVFPSWDDHPIAALREAGCRVTVSTDDPPYFHTSMRREFERLAETFGWEEDDFRAITRDSLDASFAGADTRGAIAKLLEDSE